MAATTCRPCAHALQFSRDDLAGHAVGASQDDPTSLGHRSRHTLPSHLSFEIVTLAVTKDQTCRRSTHRVRHRCAPSLKRRSIQCNELQFQIDLVDTRLIGCQQPPWHAHPRADPPLNNSDIADRAVYVAVGRKADPWPKASSPIGFPPASPESRGDRCACPISSIRAAPMRR